MGKYKAAKKKTGAPPQVKPGLPCLILIGLGMVLIAFLMYWMMKSAG